MVSICVFMNTKGRGD